MQTKMSSHNVFTYILRILLVLVSFVLVEPNALADNKCVDKYLASMINKGYALADIDTFLDKWCGSGPAGKAKVVNAAAPAAPAAAPAVAVLAAPAPAPAAPVPVPVPVPVAAASGVTPVSPASSVAATPQSGVPTSTTLTATLFTFRLANNFRKIPGVTVEFKNSAGTETVYAAGTKFDVVGKDSNNYTVICVYAPEGKQACKDESYTTSIKIVDAGVGLIRDSLVKGVFVAPFKYYIKDHTFAANSVTVGPFFGYEKESVFGYDMGLVQKYMLFAALGPTAVTVTNNSGSSGSSTNILAFSAALGAAYDINGTIKFMIAAGKDWTGNSATPYPRNAETWLTATLGFPIQ